MTAITITHYFYIPGSLSALDAVHPFTQRACYGGQTKDELIAQHGDVEVLTSDEVLQRVSAAALTAPEEITEAEFIDALNCMPPCHWRRANGAESFQMSERYTANITTVYVRLGTRYFKWRDEMGTAHDTLAAKAHAAMTPAAG